MKLLIFSDSHGSISNMADVAEQEKPSVILHLGDCWQDAERLTMACPSIPLIQVPGNCDFRPGEILERLVELEGVRILLCHGHTLKVKQGYGGAIARAKKLGADLLLFGHTHQPYLEEVDGIWVMNPGAMSRYDRESYGTVRISGGKFTCQLHDVNR